MTRKTAPAPPPARRTSPLAAPPEREPRIGAGVAAAIYFALALVYFLPALMPGKQIFGTDYSQAGYFFQDFLSKSFAAGHLPKWVPYLYGGVPLFSNPGSTFYPVRFVADWLLPVKNILPGIFLFQFFVAGWGMYLLARELGCRAWVAFVGGLAFQWTGLLTSWVYAGHDGRIIVASFTPLLFCCLHRGIRTGRLAPFVGAAATVGFALLSFQIQVAWYLLVDAMIWAVFCLVHLGVFRQRALAARVVALGIAAVAFGFAMAAVNFLSFSGYVSASPRAGSEGRGYAYSTSYSMPVANVLAMAAPEQVGASVADPVTQQPAFPVYHGPNGFKLHSEYVGAVVLVLFALGCFYARRDRYWWFFAGTGLFFLTMALGGNTPLYHLYWAVLPGLKQFRAPDLAYSAVAFSIVAMAPLALEALARARDAAVARRSTSADSPERLELVPWIAGIFLVVAILGAAAGGGGEPGGPSPAIGWMRLAVFSAAAAVALWLWTARRMGTVAVFAVLALATTADLWSLGKKFFYTLPGPGEMYAEDEVTAYLLNQPKPFRVWPIPGQSAWPVGVDFPMLYGIDQAGGEHGDQLQRYNEYVGAGSGTTPTYANLLRDPRFMNADNIRYLVISQEVGSPQLHEVLRSQQAQAIVYQNTAALGRAWLVGQAIRADAAHTLQTLQSPQWDPARNAVVESPRDLALAGPQLKGAARITRYEADRVDVATQADGAALLVLADNYYPDWKATLDGRPAQIYRTNHTFRGVVVPAGQHTVVFTFEPAGVATGWTIYLACFALLAAYGLWLLVAHVRSRREPDAPAAASAMEG